MSVHRRPPGPLPKETREWQLDEGIVGDSGKRKPSRSGSKTFRVCPVCTKVKDIENGRWGFGGVFLCCIDCYTADPK